MHSFSRKKFLGCMIFLPDLILLRSGLTETEFHDFS